MTRRLSDPRESIIHHTARLSLGGTSLPEAVRTAMRAGAPDDARLAARVRYDEEGPEVWLEWPVSVAEHERRCGPDCTERHDEW
jgi:hypothetical protein